MIELKNNCSFTSVLSYQQIFPDYSTSSFLITSVAIIKYFCKPSGYSTVYYITVFLLKVLEVAIPSENFQSFLMWLNQVSVY